MMMKKTILITCLMLLCVIPLHAQRIQVVDGDGTPIPYVTVTTNEGKYIASTDIDGWIESVGENTTIHLSQVAYKPLTIAVADIKDGRITLDEAGYDLPEVVVKPKELLYCQTYFRDVYIDEEGPIFYRAGVIDNSYDIAKKEVSAKSRHLSRAQSGFWKALYNSTSGQYDKILRLPRESYYDKICRWQQEGLVTLTDAGDGRLIISDSICQLGYIHWDAEQSTRTVSINLSAFVYHIQNKEKQEEAAKKGKTFVPDTVKQQRRTETLYQVYRTDSIGNSRTDDFVMTQYTIIGRHRYSKLEFLIQLQSFATDYAYVDKKEYKQLRKDNKVEMNIDELRRFEKVNKIPPLAPNIQEQINKFIDKD